VCYFPLIMSDATSRKEVQAQAAKRRTFAIISHPDAGKTTLTEKLLLYSGMIHTAGMVRARKGGKATSSDWMGLEQERGISISASAMQFPYKDSIINVLDTPGHQDFSEDTYRTLTAADSAVMVLDASKGVETQTRKLFAVCKMQRTPILTFINKMDLPSKDPLELLQEVEDVLGILASPINWPIGSGSSFRGVIYVATRTVTLFTRSEYGGAAKASYETMSLDQAVASGAIPEEQHAQLKDELDLLATAGNPFSSEAFLNGEITPVFFGSALTNFGVEPFFDQFVELAPPPHPYQATSTSGEELLINPVERQFSGYVFKIQANMDPAHRDRVAFMRICSGKFDKGMKMHHVRIGKGIQVANAITFQADSRKHVEEAYPGDIIGLHNHGTIQVGDTFTQGETLKFGGIPYFAPELFRRVVLKDPLRAKALQKGLVQLTEEGATQLFKPLKNNDLILGAVGILQFDVTAHRLKHEYNVECVYDASPINTVRWVSSENPAKLEEFKTKAFENLAEDGGGYLVYLATSRVNLQLTEERWPDIVFSATREL